MLNNYYNINRFYPGLRKGSVKNEVSGGASKNP